MNEGLLAILILTLSAAAIGVGRVILEIYLWVMSKAE